MTNVDFLINNLSKEDRNRVFNYVEFKVRNIINFIGSPNSKEFQNLKEHIGLPKRTFYYEQFDSVIIREEKWISYSYPRELIDTLAVVLKCFIEGYNVVTKKRPRIIEIHNVLDIKKLTPYERRLVHYALNISLPTIDNIEKDIVKNMQKNYDNIKEAHGYGEKEFYWLRELYENQIEQTYGLSSEVVEMLLDYIAIEYNKSNNDEITQMLNKNYQHIDNDITPKQLVKTKNNNKGNK